jgi:hypothetical protein
VNARGEIQGSPEDIQWQAYETFFDVIELLLKRRVSLIAEAAFQHDHWEPKLEPIKQFAHIRVVLCTIDPQLARARYIARGLADPDRELFHADRPVRAAREGRELPIGIYNPPHFGVPILHVDTTDSYQPAFESILSFAIARNNNDSVCR